MVHPQGSTSKSVKKHIKGVFGKKFLPNFSTMPSHRHNRVSMPSVNPSNFYRGVANYAYRNRGTIAKGVKRAFSHLSGNHSAKHAKRRRVQSSYKTSNAVTSVSDRQPKIVRGKRKIHLKGRKHVKVSANLRKKIVQVTDSHKVHGYFQDNRVDILEPGSLPGQQTVERIPNRTTGYQGYLFNYDRILHAASRLWNGKAANQNPVYTDVNNFNPADSVIEVNKQWWTFRMRNNSQRTATLHFYKCQSKNAVQLSSAFDSWSLGLAQMVADGSMVSTGITTNTMHTGPTTSVQFRAGWRSECTKVILDPGQAYTFSISGPAMTYRGQNFYDQGTYKTVQKQDIHLIVASNVDLAGSEAAIGGAAGPAGYVGDASVPEFAQERVYIEGTYHCNLSMPEKVGGISTAVASIFQNANRVRRVCVDDFQPVAFSALLHRRDEENPITQST